MFKFLKEKLKGAVEKFSKDVDSEAETKEVESKPGIFGRIFGKKEEQPGPVQEMPDKEPDAPAEKEETEEELDPEEFEKELGAHNEEEVTEEKEVEVALHEPLMGYDEEKKDGIFDKIKKTIVTKILSGEKFNELFFDLEVILLENNVAMEVIEKIKGDLRRELVNRPIPRRAVLGTITGALSRSIQELFIIDTSDFVSRVRDKKPTIISFVGVNGSGKTTTIAKIAYLLKKNGLRSVIAAGDTFRAASIEQLQVHADNIGVKLVKHSYGSDPAAVAYDAVNYAKAKQVDVVLVDTAGRLHNNKNLMDEVRKIIRVAKPDMNIFIGESITGNDCVEQAKQFDEAVGIDAIILSKADVDEKGGAAISVSYVTGKPIIFLGKGQDYGDLVKFQPEEILDKLGLGAS